MKWRHSKYVDAASESPLLSSEKEGRKSRNQCLFAPTKFGTKKISHVGKINCKVPGCELDSKNNNHADGDTYGPFSQFSALQKISTQKPTVGTSGDQSGSDHFHSQDEKEPVKSSQLFSSFAPEINLQRMGYAVSDTIEWDRIHLPAKSDLHKQIHFRITNCINPDVLIRIGSSEFRYHMLVLQCYSSFFDEKSVRQIELPENVVSKEAFACIYDWMLHLSQDSYHLLRRDNILSIFSAAQYLGIKELEEQCWAFIDNEELFIEDTAFLLYLDARKSNNLAVMELMVPRIQRFFLTLVSSKDWLELSVEEVCVFLNSNYISVHCEMEVFMSGVRWLMHDWDNRGTHLVDVMGCVRFGLIAPWQLVDIRRNPESPEFIEVTKNPRVQQLVEDGLAFAIIKYWYVHESRDYYHWIDSLKLKEPAPRNWIGSEKSFVSYREFLNDLDLYRRPNSAPKKIDQLPNDGYTEDDSSLSDAASTSIASGPVITRKSVSRKHAPVPSLAEYFAAHKNGVELLKLRRKMDRMKLTAKNDSELEPLKEIEPEKSESTVNKIGPASKRGETASWGTKGRSQCDETTCPKISNNSKRLYQLQPAERDVSSGKNCGFSLRSESLSSIELKSNLDKLVESFKDDAYHLNKATTAKSAMIPIKEFTGKTEEICKQQIKTSESKSVFQSYFPLNLSFHENQTSSFGSKNLSVKKRPPFDVNQSETLRIQEEFERRVKAAVCIQAAFRGHIARKFVKLLKLRTKTMQQSCLGMKKTARARGSSLQENSRQSSAVQNTKVSFQPSASNKSSPLQENSRQSSALQNAKVSFQPSVSNKTQSTVNKIVQVDSRSSSKKTLQSNKSLMMVTPRNYLEKGSLFFEHQESILVFGGIDSHRPYGAEHNTGKDAYRYNPEKNVWELITELPEPRHHHSVAFLKGRIYVLGGADPHESDTKTKSRIVSTVWSFEPVSRAWYTETSMKIARKNFGLVAIGGKLYAIGGQDKYHRILSNVERFDPQTGKWEEMAPLEIGRMGVAAAKYRDVIWVCGGMACAKKSILSQRVDCYDTQRNVWIQCIPLCYPRCFGVLFPMDDSLYLIGGAGRQKEKETETYSVSAVDVWDSQKKEWCLKTEMAIPRHGHSVCYLGSQILILGGVTTTRMCALNKVESWCSQRSVWVRGIADLPVALSGHGSITLPPACLM